MPEMDGFTTCVRLKAHPGTKNIPVIFMTALTDTVDKVGGFDLGAVDYIGSSTTVFTKNVYNNMKLNRFSLGD